MQANENKRKQNCFLLFSLTYVYFFESRFFNGLWPIPGFVLVFNTSQTGFSLLFLAGRVDRRGPFRAVEIVIADDDSAGFCFAQENV
jgi:hypothetical protein